MDLSHPWTTWPHICNELPFTSREFVGVGDNGDPLPLGGGRTVENEREKKMEISPRIWLRVVYKEGEERGRGKRTEIRCCVKYNTYFTTEIPIPSTRRSTVKRLGWTSFLVETFFYRNDPFRIGVYVLNAKIVFQDYYVLLTFIYCHI